MLIKFDWKFQHYLDKITPNNKTSEKLCNQCQYCEAMLSKFY